MISEGRNHISTKIQICFISAYDQIIKRNNQIIKMNNQIFKITVVWIRPRLADVGSNMHLVVHFLPNFIHFSRFTPSFI